MNLHNTAKKNINTVNINMENTIKYWDYIHSANENEDLDSVKLDDKGNAVYRGKTILTIKGLPLNDDNAYNYPEIKLMFYLRGIKPREGCDPNDTVTNGVLGCYMDVPKNDM